MFTLTNYGVAWFASNPGLMPDLGQFRISDGYNYTPTPASTSLQGVTQFSGTPSAPRLMGTGEIVYDLYMDLSVGDFSWGEVGLYLNGNLFGVGTYSTLMRKTRLTGSQSGNAVSLSLILRPGQTSVVSVLSNSDNELNVARGLSIDLLPPAQSAYPNVATVASPLNPQKALLAVAEASVWNISGYDHQLFSGSLVAATANTVRISASFDKPFEPGETIVQFVNGPAAGYSRVVTSWGQSSGTLGFAVALPVNPTSGDNVLLSRWTQSVRDSSLAATAAHQVVAEQKALEASQSAASAEIAVAAALTHSQTAADHRLDAGVFASDADQSALAAAASAASVAADEVLLAQSVSAATTAATSATSAATSASASATSSASSASAALSSHTAAGIAANAAQASATAAGNSATAASSSAATAANSESTAAGSATSAGLSADAAAASAAVAVTKAQEASTSSTTAVNAADTATSASTAAAASALSASQDASEATSEALASIAASEISTVKAAEAAASAATASSQATSATSSASSSATSAAASSASATSASASATTATTQAGIATTAATAALQDSTLASTARTQAQAAAAAALVSQTSAAASATTATTARDQAVAAEASTSVLAQEVGDLRDESVAARDLAVSSAATSSSDAATSTTQAGLATAASLVATTKAAEAVDAEEGSTIAAAASLISSQSAALHRASASTHADNSETYGQLAAAVALTHSQTAAAHAVQASASADQALSSSSLAQSARDVAQGHATVASAQAGTATTRATEAASSASLAALARDASQTARDLAAGYAADSEDSSVLASTRAAEAAVSVSVAQAARDAATVNADVYVDVATGLAAVADGVQFQVVSADGMLIRRYTRSPGPVATLVGSELPTELFISSKIESQFSVSPDYLWSVIDSSRRRLLSINSAGELEAKMPGYLPQNIDTIEGDLFSITDVNGRVLLKIDLDGNVVGKMLPPEEVITARGSQASLNTRLSRSLSPYGLPKKPVFGEWFMRETRQRLRKLAMAEATQFVVASIGDSWTHNADRWCRPTARALITQYGDAGSGWVGFGFLNATFLNGNVDTAKVTTAFSGTWDHTVYYTSVSPDLGQASSSTVGSKVTITAPASTSAVRLFYIGSLGVVRYRFDGGSWTSLDLAGSGLQAALLTGVPSTAFTLELEVLSGTVTLCGLDVQKTTSGVRWHKLGATGSRSDHWGTVDAAQWQAGLSLLTPNLVVIMHGTNDQSGSPFPSTFAARIQTIVTRCRLAMPSTDILIVMPCENGRANIVPMADYASAAYEVADANQCAFMDLQYFFGESFSQYSSVSSRPWFNADLIHPEPATGGRAIADAIIRLITTL
jgi:hypothetical protein